MDRSSLPFWLQQFVEHRKNIAKRLKRSPNTQYLETFERRVLLSNSLISGASVAASGSPYTVKLNAPPQAGNSWLISWGDGTAAQSVGGSATTATHTFQDGPATRTVTATVTGLADPIDTSFGSNHSGKITTNLGSVDDYGYKTILQPDGKILLAGGAGFSIARYNADGTPDNTFGANHNGLVAESGADASFGAALQPDGKILVGGGSNFGLARFNSDGTLDTSFNNGGKTVGGFGVTYIGYDLALLPNGKVIMIGKNGNDLVVARFNANGTVDRTFGTNGKTTVDLQGSYDKGFSLAVQNDGSFFVGGQSRNSAAVYDAAVVKFTAGGFVDTTFGTASNGIALVDFGHTDDAIYALSLLPNGQILAAGAGGSASTGYDFAIARFNSNGTRDLSFGGNNTGFRLTDFGNGGDQALAMAVLPTGKILLVGRAQSKYNAMDFGLARYNADGTPDTTFGTNGKVTTDFLGSSDYAESVAVQPDGDVVLGGASSTVGSNGATDFALARYVMTTNGQAAGAIKVSVSGTNATAPNVPILVNVNALSATEAFVRWTSGGGGAADAYVIERKRSVDSDWSQVGTVSGTATAFYDPTLTAGSTYEYRVWAQNGLGRSSTPGVAASNVVTPTQDTTGYYRVLAVGPLIHANNGLTVNGSLAIGNGDWILAGSPQGAILQAVNGSLIVNESGQAYAFGQSGALVAVSTGIVFDDKYGTAADTQNYSSGSIAVTVEAAAAVAYGAATVFEGDTYRLRLTAPGVPSGASTWTINWGDGSAPQTVGNVNAVDHVFAQGGRNWSISAIARNAAGNNYASPNANVSVLDMPPTLTMGGEAIAAVGQPYTLNLQAADPGGVTVSSWVIDWGDGSSPQTIAGNPNSATHTFTAVSAFTIKATVTDAAGSYAVDPASVQVLNVSGGAAAYLLASATGDARVNLKWTRPNDPASTFAVEQSDDDGTSYHTVTFLPAGASSYEVRGLTPSTNYTFRVRVIGSGSGTYGPSNHFAVQTLTAGIVYANDFEPTSVTATEWSDGKRGVTPVAARTFLGEFGNQNVGLNLDGLSTHSNLTVSFDLYVIRSWDGVDNVQWGPDQWNMAADGQTLLGTSFSNHLQPSNALNGFQSYPNSSDSGAQYPAMNNASERNTLGYMFYRSDLHKSVEMDSVYHISKTFNHVGGTLALTLKALGLQALADESWGIDNIRITAGDGSAGDLTATATTAGSVNLRWVDQSGGTSGVSIERSTDGTHFTPLATVPAGTDVFEDLTGQPDTTYFYKVSTAVADGSPAVSSNIAHATTALASASYSSTPTGVVNVPLDGTLVTTPVLVAGVHYRIVGAGTLFLGGDLGWADADYAFSKSSNANRPNSRFANVNYGISINDGSLDANKYAYWGAYNSTHEYSIDVVGTGQPLTLQFHDDNYSDNTSDNLTSPLRVTIYRSAASAPTSLTASPDQGTGKIRLNWTDNSLDETGFRVERGTDGVTFSLLQTVASNTVQFDDSSVVTGQTYYYRIVPLFGSTAGPVSNVASASLNDPAGVTITGIPAAAVEGTAINLTAVGSNVPSNTAYSWTVRKDGAAYPVYAGNADLSFTPDDNGIYEVNVVATSGGQPVASKSATIAVLNANPIVTIQGLTPTIAEGRDVFLTAVANDPGQADQATLIYQWTVTHGEQSVQYSGPTLQFRPDDGSAYAISLVVTDKDNGPGTATGSIQVVPAGASDLIAETASQNEIVLRWVDNSNIEDSYRIEAQSLGGSYTVLGTVPANVTAFRALNLEPGTLYSFKLTAMRNGASLSSIPGAASTTPTPLTGLTASAVQNSDSAVRVNWEPAAAGVNPDVAKIEIQRRSASDLDYSVVATIAAGTGDWNAHGWTDTNLAPGTTYYYRVRQYTTRGAPIVNDYLGHSQGGNFSAYTAVASAVTNADSATPPSAVLASATAVPGQAKLEWPADATFADGFDVRVSTDGGQSFADPIVVAGASATGTTISFLDPAQNYVFAVSAYNQLGESTTTISSETTLTRPATPAAPSVVTRSNSQIDLAWTNPAAGTPASPTGFVIERSLDGQTFGQIGMSYGTSFTDGKLRAGTAYVYRIRSFYSPTNTVRTGDVFYSGYSATGQNQTTSVLPLAPVAPAGGAPDSQALDQAGRVLLTWKAPLDNNRDGYEVEYTTDPDRQHATYTNALTEPTNGGEGSQNYYLSGLDLGTTYYTRIRAYNSVGDSAWYEFAAVATRSTNAPVIQATTPPNDYPGANSNRELVVHWSQQLTSTQLTPSSYLVEISTDGTHFDTKDIANAIFPSSGPGTQAYQARVTGLEAGTNYQFRVRAVYQSETVAYSDYSAPSTATQTTALLPAIPTGVVITTSRSGLAYSATVQWQGSPVTDSYDVELSTDGTNFTPAMRTSAAGSATTATFASLSPATTYYVHVRAVNSVGISAWSDPASKATPGPLVVPAAVVLSLTQPSTANAGTLNLSWTTSPTATGYRVEIAPDNNNGATPLESSFSALATTAATTYSVEGLTASTRYFFRVIPSNEAGDGPVSNVVDGTTSAFDAPTNLAAQIVTSKRQVLLTWAETDENEAGFEVQMSTDGLTFTSAKVGSPLTTLPNMRAYLVQGLAPNTNYYFRVRAVGKDSKFYSKFSDIADVRTEAVTKPAQPTILSLVAISDHQIRVKWEDHAGNEDNYEVLVWWKGGTDVPDYTLGSDTNDLILDKLSNGVPVQGNTSYEIRVRAKNWAGGSVVSDMLEVTTPPAPPAALSVTALSASSSQISWSPSDVGVINGYHLQRSLDGHVWENIGPSLISATTYTDTGVTAHYRYRVSVSAVAGESPYSTAVVPTQAQPTNLAVTSFTDTTIALSWNAVSTATQYRIERRSSTNGSWKIVGLLTGVNSTAFNDTGLTEGGSYSYRVRAQSPVADSSFSLVAQTTALHVPSDLSVTRWTGQGVAFTWTNNSSVANQFDIDVFDQGTWHPIGQNIGQTTTQLSYHFDPSQSYQFRIRASLNSLAKSPYSTFTFTSPSFAATPALSSGLVDAESAALTWIYGNGGAVDPTAFVLQRRTSGGSWFNRATFGGAARSFTDHGLADGSVYDYRVVAINPTGESDYSSTVTVQTTLRAPTNLKATAISATQIKLSWSSPAARYAFQVSQLKDGVWTTISPQQRGTESVVNGTFNPSTAFQFRVASVLNTQSSAFISTSITTAAYPSPSSALHLVSVDADSVALAWSAGSTDEAGFRVERLASSSAVWQIVGRPGAGVTSFVDHSVRFASAYQYRVVAFNGFGDAASTSSLSVQTPLAAPGSLRAYAVNGHQIDLSWVPLAGETVNAYKVYQSTQSGVLGTLLDTVTVNQQKPTAPLAYTATGPFAPNTPYYYTVRAVGTSGESEGTTVAVTTGNFPAAPTNLTFDVITSKYRLPLRWNAGAGGSGGDFRIYRRSAGVAWTPVSVALPPFTTTYVDRVSPGINYQYRIVEVNKYGESGYAVSQPQASLLVDPASPLTLKVTGDNDTTVLNLAWDDHSTDELGYQIQRAPFRTGNWDERLFEDVPGTVASTLITVGATSGGTATWRSTGLAAGTTYFYRVRAIRPDGPGDWSPISYGITSLAAPASALQASYPVGMPGGVPAVGGGGKLHEYTFAFGNTDSYTFDPAFSGFRGSVKLKPGPILGSSLSDALSKAVIPEQSHITKIFSDGSEMDVPWMNPLFFRLDNASYVPPLSSAVGSDGRYDLGEYFFYIAGQNGDSPDDTLQPEIPLAPQSLSANDGLLPQAAGGTNAGGGGGGGSPGRQDTLHPCISGSGKGSGSGKPDQPDPPKDPTPKITVPKKLDVPVHNGDGDGDGIIDFADGFDRFQQTGDRLNPTGKLIGDENDDSSASPGTYFVPMTISLPGDAHRPKSTDDDGNYVEPTSDPLDVSFQYSASDPMGVGRTGTGTTDDPYLYGLPSGALRLWIRLPGQRKLRLGESGYVSDIFAVPPKPDEPYYPAIDSNSAGGQLDPHSVNAGGDFIPSGESFSAFRIFGYSTSATVYVECVKQSTGLKDQSITVSSDGLSATTKVTGYDVHLNVDSLNAREDGPDNTGAPDADPAAQDQHENDPSLPGKVIVVNDADRDHNGLPDAGQGFTETEAANPVSTAPVTTAKFTPITISIPNFVDRTKAALRISYDQPSDPAKGNYTQIMGTNPAQYAYSPAPGALRIWTKPADQPRNAKSVFEGGDFVTSSGLVAEYDADGNATGNLVPTSDYLNDHEYHYDYVSLAKLGFGGNSNTITLYVEAVRSIDAATITVTLDPDGIDLHQDKHPDPPEDEDLDNPRDPPDFGDTKPIPYLVSDTIKIRAIQDYAPDAAMVGDVRAVDGAVSVSETDLQSNGAVPWSLTRTWTDARDASAARTSNGGWFMFPKLLQASGTVVAQLASGALYFDKIDNKYVERFGGHDKLVETDGQFSLDRPDGSSILFNGFDEELPGAQRGIYAGETDAGGNTMEVSAYTDEGQIQTVSWEDTSFDFAYSDSGDNKGEITDVTFSNATGIVRKVAYEYYTKADGDNDGTNTAQPFQGNQGDLKSAEVTDTDGNRVSFSYYRYASKSSPAAPSVLKFVMDNAATARAQYDGLTLATASDSDLKKYASSVISGGALAVQGAGKSQTDLTAQGTYSAGGGGQNSDSAGQTPIGYNVWTYQRSLQQPGMAAQTVYLNYAGQEIASQTNADGKTYSTFTRYDLSGRPILVASPSAIDNLDTQGGQDAFQIAHLKPDAGVITTYSYFDSGYADGYLKQSSLRHGESGTDIPQVEYTYIKHEDDDASVVLPSSTKIYRNDDGSGGLVTSTEYGSDWTHLQPTDVTTTPPSVDSSQNGQGGSGAVETAYDEFGRVTDVTDGDGYATHTGYDDSTGAVVAMIVDSTGLDLATTVDDFDGLGRPLTVTDPKSNQTKYQYVDTDTTSGVIVTPQSDFLGHATWTDWAKGLSDTLTFNTTGNVVESLTRDQLDYGLRVLRSNRYYELSGVVLNANTGVSAPTGGQYTTQLNYDDAGRQNETIEAENVKRTTTYDQLGRVKDVQVNGSPVQQNSYDDGVTGGGDGNLTKVTLSPGGDEPNRVTTNTYDWRDRLVATDDTVRLTYLTLDNLGQATRQDVYDSAQAQFSGLNNDVPSESQDIADASAIRARTDTYFDNRGQVYRTEVSDVSPTYAIDGTITSATVGSGKLVTDSFHDGRGNVIKTVAPGGLVTQATVDGAGRTTETTVGTASQVVSRTATDFDKNGNAIRIVTTEGGPAGDRTTYVRNEYDAADRLKATVNFGTTSVSPTAALPNRAFADGRNAFLRTDYTYTEAGDVDEVTDPRGIISKQYHDSLGRLSTQVDAYTTGTPTNNTDHRTFYEYNGDDQQTSSNVSLPGGGTMSTKYQYDARGRLKLTQFPGSTAGVSGGSGNEESYTYNNLDELKTKTERTGVTHTYTHDVEGNVTRDAAAIPTGSTVDNRVNALAYTYDELGRLTSAKTQGNLGNEVRRQYNGFGQLVTEFQQHGGDADATSPAIVYGYGSASAGSRLATMQYPDGRTLTYGYNTIDGAIGRPSSISDSVVGAAVETYTYLGLSTLVGKARPEAGESLQYYGRTDAPNEAGDGYTGLDRFGRVMDQGWLQGGTYIDRNQYEYDAGSDLLLKNNLVNNQFSELFQGEGDVADSAGSNPANTAYDRFGRFRFWMRGQLATTGAATRPNTVSGTPQRHQSWSYDAEGNWLTFYDGQRQNTTAFDSRNRATTGTQGDGTNPSAVSFFYDANGALASSTDGQNRKITYDAWGHATKVELYDGTTFAGSMAYVYDALGRVARETSAFTLNNTQTDLYYDQNGHAIVEDDSVIGQPNPTVTADRENVWGGDGNLIFVEDQNVASPGTGLVREYAQQDAFGNTTSVLMKDGMNGYVVKERYVYDPRGLTTVLKPDWSGYDMTGGVPYGNDPKNSFNTSIITFRYLAGQGRWQGQTRLYETAGGGSYDPVLGASQQPRMDAASHSFNSYGWWGDMGYAFGGQLAQMGNSLNKLTNPVLGVASYFGYDPMAGFNPFVIPGSGYDPHMETWRNDVGMDGLIPVWGSAKQAYYDFGYAGADFEQGQYFGAALDTLTGFANVVNAASDALLLGMAGKALFKAGSNLLSRTAARSSLQVAEQLSRNALNAASSRTITADLIESELRGVTKRSTMVADAIADGRLKVNLYDSREEMLKVYRRYGGTAENVQAFNVGTEMHIFQSEKAFGSAVHEGMHGLDNLANRTYGFMSEFRAFSAQREFQLAKGLPAMADRNSILRHILESYPRFVNSMDATTRNYLVRRGVMK